MILPLIVKEREEEGLEGGTGVLIVGGSGGFGIITILAEEAILEMTRDHHRPFQFIPPEQRGRGGELAY